MEIKEVKAKNIMTKSNLPASDYAANPYIGCSHACKYCYASFMKRFTGHDGQVWGKFIDVKNWDEIKNKEKFQGKTLFLGSVTDAYQPIEEKYKKTRLLLEQLQGNGINLSISTKSDLILRDLELIKTFPNAKVSWSINTLDENFRRDMDCSVSVERKIEVMKKFHQAGVKTVCFISPIFPEITDCKAIINKVRNICDMIWLENLNLRGEYKPVIMKYIAQKYPQHLKLYNQIYNKNDMSYWITLDRQMKQFCENEGFNYLSASDDIDGEYGDKLSVFNFFYHEEIKKLS